MNPISANLNVFWAFLTLSGFPSDVRYMNEPYTNIRKSTAITSVEAAVTRFPNITSKHLNVGTPSTTHPFAGYRSISALRGQFWRTKRSASHRTAALCIVASYVIFLFIVFGDLIQLKSCRNHSITEIIRTLKIAHRKAKRQAEILKNYFVKQTISFDARHIIQDPIQVS